MTLSMRIIASALLLLLLTVQFSAIASAKGRQGVSMSQSILRHGNSYVIQPVGDEDLYLTATQHTFRPKQGVYVGRVLISEYTGGPNQYWDAITWPNTQENQFWLYSKSSALNEITAVPLPNADVPPKNLVQIIYLELESPSSVYHHRTNAKYQFLIKSLELNKCIESHGLDYQISYENCNFDKVEQRFVASPMIDVETAAKVKVQHSA